MASTILIVDDDRMTRLGLAELLAGAGYEAIAIGSFEEAARRLRTSPPDLLIADVRLGPFNGLQLVISSPVPVPAIIITGFADPVLESDARRRGAEYVLKPIDPPALLRLVEEKLQAARAGFGIPRRWERKPVIGGLPARIGDAPARVLDVSYGGLRFELEGTEGRTPPPTLNLTFPAADLSVNATIVWKTLVAGHTWLCGASLATDAVGSPEWTGLVDAVA